MAIHLIYVNTLHSSVMCLLKYVPGKWSRFLNVSFKIELAAPCEQRFLSCMAFSVYEVVGVACQSRSWFVLYTPKPTTRLTTDANDFVNAKSHEREKPLLTG